MKVHFITQGCSANVADSEVMQGLVKSEGNELVETISDADVVVFNTCTVKGPTEAAFKKQIEELEKLQKKVVLAGCIPQGQPKDFSDYSRVGTYQIKKITEAVSETAKGNVVSFLERKDEGRLNVPKVRKNPFVEIVPILQGCLNSCTFCKTKHARGVAASYPVNDVVRHISSAVEEGVTEIWLTSQDNAVYGLEFGSNLAELLKAIVSIDRDFKIRVGMGNPKYMLPYLDDLIAVLKHPKIYKFIHIPLQSGSDKVLLDMKREYTAAQYKEIIARIKKEIHSMTFMTDVICGFPTETEDDFNETIRVLRETKPDLMNVSRFWPRPGTPAAFLEPIDGAISKERAKILMDLFMELGLENNQKYIGTEHTVMILEHGKDNSSIGKTENYKQVVVKGLLPIGTSVKVRINSVTGMDLRGEII